MAKDMNELIEERKAKLTALEGVLAKAKLETRKLDTDEGQEFETINAEIQAIDKEIETKRNLVNKNNIIIKKTNNTMSNFSLSRAILNASELRGFSDAENEVFALGRKEFQKAGLSYNGQITLPMEYRGDILAGGTQAEGSVVVQTDKLEMIPFLRANLILVKAGAQMMTGLVGNVSIPVLSTGNTANWKAENDSAVDAAPGFSEVDLSPHRITAYYDVSKQFLLQDSVGANALLQNDIVLAVSDLLEATAFGTLVGTAYRPEGLFYNPTLVFSSGSTFAQMISLESAVAAANALKSPGTYLLHPTSVGKLKSTAKAATVAAGFIAENSQINGYPYLTSTNLPTVSGAKGVIFGCFADMIIGQWGGIDLIVDPYTVAKEGKIRVVINAYFDVKLRRKQAFAKGTIA